MFCIFSADRNRNRNLIAVLIEKRKMGKGKLKEINSRIPDLLTLEIGFSPPRTSCFHLNTAGFNHCIVIDQFQPSDQGTYMCVARNEYNNSVKTSSEIGKSSTMLL